jgi:predicted component of type VI protein secretion system
MSEFTFIEQSPSQGAEHAVEQGTTIGREGCDITLGDPDVSRRHAEIQISNGDIAISDLGSTNGTFVNGERIDQPRTLRDGDEVRIGAVVWRLRAPAGATRIAGTMDAAAATPSQATTVRPAAAPEPPAEEPPTAPQPAAPEPAAPAVSEPATPAVSEPATPATPEPAAPAPAPVAAADQPTAHSPAPAPSRALSRGDVPQPDFAPSAIRRVVPVDAPTAFTPDTQGSRRGGSAATRGGATLFTTIVIAATTAGVLIYYITEPFK